MIDPSSRELLDLTLARVTRLPVLLVITFRPEFPQNWSGQPHVTLLALNRLGQRDVMALVRELARNAALGSEVVEEIVQRTDGVPLFVEELTRAVLEGADQDNRIAAVLAASPLPSLAIPATLHASLIARLDRLGPAAKEVAQIGAVIGRGFSYELIQSVAQRPQQFLKHTASPRCACHRSLFQREELADLRPRGIDVWFRPTQSASRGSFAVRSELAKRGRRAVCRCRSNSSAASSPRRPCFRSRANGNVRPVPTKSIHSSYEMSCRSGTSCTESRSLARRQQPAT